MIRRLLFSGVTLLPALFFIASCGPRMPVSSPNVMLRQDMPKKKAVSLDGKEVAIPEPGTITVLDFWASYCEPCLEHLDALESFFRESDKNKVRIIGVCEDEDPGAAKKIVADLDLTFVQVADTSQSLAKEFHVESVPAALVIDSQGRVRLYLSAQDYRPKKIKKAVRALLEEDSGYLTTETFQVEMSSASRPSSLSMTASAPAPKRTSAVFRL